MSNLVNTWTNQSKKFTQDDAHVFARPDQLKEEFINVIDLVLYI